MYKVMIIDDEPIIVEGLSKSIDWEKYHCQVVATAHNGREGKKLIEEIEAPDTSVPEQILVHGQLLVGRSVKNLSE